MYGITEDQKIYIDEKIERNKNYLKNFTFDIDGNQFNLLDSDMNANISPKKYFSEVNNRVNTLFNYAKTEGLKPIFLTITAPPELHPYSKTDASPYSILTKQRQFKYDGMNYKDINPHDTSLYLSDLWAKFLRLSIFKKLKKQYGKNMIYLRVYEPMKSGVPHIHAMIFVPHSFVIPLKKKYKEYFGKYGIKQLDYRYTWHNQAGGAVAYILKYINKTFKNAKEDIMTEEAYYFAIHRIRRFITSQTLIPLKYYRKIKHIERLQDLKYTTELYNSGVINHYFNGHCIMEMYIDDDYETSERVIYRKDPNLSFALASKKFDLETQRYRKHTKKDIELNSFVYRPYDEYEQIPTKWTKRDSVKPLEVNIDGTEYLYSNKRLSRPSIDYSKMSHYDLLAYFNNLDIETVDLNHYGHINNLLYKMGLVDIEYNLSDLRNYAQW